MNTRGLSLLEVAVSGALFSIAMAITGSAMAVDSQTQRVFLGQMGPEARARDALERVVTELRTAGIWGEDINQNGVFDDGEDLNRDGRFDADWNLPDGGADRSDLSFNRRVDERDTDGALLASGIYSGRVTYRLEGDTLVRETQVREPNGTLTVRRNELTTGLAELRFSRQDRLITVALAVSLPPGVYASDRLTVTSSVWLTN